MRATSGPMTTPIVLKDITDDQLREYFKFIDTHSVQCAWTQSQAELIGRAFQGEIITRNLLLRLIAMVDLVGVPGVVVSAMTAGFQCGREFENRLMAKAMRDQA